MTIDQVIYERALSQVFPGLWLDPDAPLRGDFARLSAMVQQGLASAEHADFVGRLHRT